MDPVPTPEPSATVRDPGPALLGETVREGDGPRRNWWESTPREGQGDSPPPQLAGEAYGALLRSQGLDPAGEGDGPRYDVERALGQGSGGTVWGARDRRLDRPIAVKVLNRGADLRGFLEEARITAALQHPNVLPVYDLDLTAAGDPCFAMKRNEGQSLGEALRLEPGRRPAAIATVNGLINVFIGVGQALAYAHHRGIIHQDVKPDNILLGDYGEVLLVDWGCALRGEARGGRLYGTPLYMAPEQARREFADRRSDVHCFGASLFHALVGRPPTVPGGDAAAFWAAKRSGRIDAPTEAERRRIAPALLAIALKAIAADPAQRYATVDALLDDLRSYQAGLAVGAWREPPWHLLRRWYRQHRAQCWTAVAALLLVVTAGGLWWREKLRERADWRLVLSEDFTDAAASAQRWRPMSLVPFSTKKDQVALTVPHGTQVELRGGRLELGDEDRIIDVALRERVFGDLRAEWEATALRNPYNLNCFLGDDRSTAYTFHVGGWADPSYVCLTRGDGEQTVLATARLDPPVAVGRTYRFRLEREGVHLRLWIDGRLLIDHEVPSDPQTVAPQSLGFDSWRGSRCAIGAVRLWARPLPERISPLDLAKQVGQGGDHASALRQYRDLAEAYAGRELGVEAAFHAGIEALRAGEAERGTADLRRLLIDHPRHALAPHALFALEGSAVERGDIRLVEFAREGLAAHAGHPLQQRLLGGIGRERLAQVRSATEIRSLDQSRFSPAAVPAVEATIAELERWSARYGVVPESNLLLAAAGEAMLHLGRNDLVVAHWPARDQTRCWAMICLGRYDEALARFPYLGYARIIVLTPLEHWAALAADARIGAPTIQRLIGDGDALRARFPHEPLTALTLMAHSRAAEVAGDPEFPSVWRTRALLQLGRVEEALAVAEAGDHELQAWALAALGREEEALADHQRSFWPGHLAILARLRHGDIAGADALLERTRLRIPDHRRFDELAIYHLIPALRRRDLGDAAGCDALFAAAHEDVAHCMSLRLERVFAFALGLRDEAGFAQQPDQRKVARDLPLARALAAERAGDRAAAIAAWQAWLAGLEDVTDEWMIAVLARWRLADR